VRCASTLIFFISAVRGRKLEDRRAVLEDVVRRRAPWIQFSESTEGDGPQLGPHGCGMDLEGIISERRGSLYLSGKSAVWRKTKSIFTDHFAVMGIDRTGRSLRVSSLHDRGLSPCG
jgi:bifunctional non-homologous end joining protein LigD